MAEKSEKEHKFDEWVSFLKEPSPEELSETIDKYFGGKTPINYMPHRNCYLYSEKQEDGSAKIKAEPIDADKPMDVSGLQHSFFKPEDSSIEAVRTIQRYLQNKESNKDV